MSKGQIDKFDSPFSEDSKYETPENKEKPIKIFKSKNLRKEIPPEEKSEEQQKRIEKAKELVKKK